MGSVAGAQCISFFTMHPAISFHLPVLWCLCIPVLTTPPFSSLGCLSPFHSSREAAPPIPFCLHCSSSLFTLCSSAPLSKQLFHYGVSRRFSHTVLLQSSLAALSDSPPQSLPGLRWHACHYCHEAQFSSRPEELPGRVS